MKTYADLEKSDLEFREYVKPCDEIDEEMFNYFGEVIAPVFGAGDDQQHVYQVGEAKDCLKNSDILDDTVEVLTYETFLHIRKNSGECVYYYLGCLPELESIRFNLLS